MSQPHHRGGGRGGARGQGPSRGAWRGASGPSSGFHGTGANASPFGGGAGESSYRGRGGGGGGRGAGSHERGGGGMGRGGGGRDAGRARGGRGGRGFRRGGRFEASAHIEDGKSGDLVCGHVEAPLPGAAPAASTSDGKGEESQPSPVACQWRTNSPNALMLHRADRHLVYPPGGKAEVDRIDPILQEELKEKARRDRKAAAGGKGKAPRKGGSDDEEEDDEDEGDEDDVEKKYNSLIPGLNISLSTPELIDMWIRERKKRWPTDAVVAKKRAESWDTDAAHARDAKRRKWGEGAGGEVQAKEEGADRTRSREIPSKPAQDIASVPARDGGDDESDEDDDDGPPEESSSRPPPGTLDDGAKAASSDASSSESESDSDSSSSSSSDDEDEGGSTGKPSTSAAKTAAGPGAPVCKFRRQGRCTRGASCRQSHQEPSSSTPTTGPTPAAPFKHRPRPRQEAPNPFQAPNLLRALLKNEISQHVSYVCQVVRFLVRNDALRDVELHVGDAEEQRRRRSLVQEIDGEGKKVVEGSSEEEKLGAPLVEGGLPTVPSSLEVAAQDQPTEGAEVASSAPRALFRPPSPLLRPLDSLNYPPEPDPMIFLDPLRAADPHPLTRAEVLRIATDGPLRSLLVDDSSRRSLHWSSDSAQMHAGFRRALETLDALPTEAHRTSAVELILGVSEQSALHAHQLGPTFVRPSKAMGSKRVIGEKELFRLGLRCGDDEVRRFKLLAQRVSELVGRVEFWAGDATDPDSLLAFGGLGGGTEEEEERAKRRREEARRAMWEKEADRRDMLRKLGIDVD